MTNEWIYRRLIVTSEHDCPELSEQARRHVAGNFLLMLISRFLSKLADALANPKIVLPWVMETVHAPLYLLGFLVPIRESGSLIPQVLIAGYVRRLTIRKWVWVAGKMVEVGAMTAIALVAWLAEGNVAGWSILLLLILFSLARGFCSVASKDVTGKTIAKSARGQTNGWSASSAGLLTLLLGSGFLLTDGEDLSAGSVAALLGAAVVLWSLAALAFSRLREFPGDAEMTEAHLLKASWQRLALLGRDRPFRHFVITRSLLLCSALTAPYYVILAQKTYGSQPQLLGVFILASGAASVLSSPIWGRFSDRSSRRVMMAGAGMTLLLGMVVFVVDQVVPQWLASLWFLPGCYFLLSIAHQGVRIGRKTYVVNLGKGNQRTDYVAVSNTLIGVILLLLGFTGALTSFIGLSTLILLLSLMGGAGMLMARCLPDVE
nr:MFS transporter [uncultured Desulfuromonas sp.]